MLKEGATAAFLVRGGVRCCLQVAEESVLDETGRGHDHCLQVGLPRGRGAEMRDQGLHYLLIELVLLFVYSSNSRSYPLFLRYSLFNFGLELRCRPAN